MKKLIQAIIIVSLTIIFLEGTKTYSQCQIQATATPNIVCAGDAVSLSSTGGCGYFMKSDFNLGAMGLYWSSYPANPIFTNPCGAGPVGLHCWVGTTASPIRTLETASINASVGNCVIEWDMRYGRAQSGGSCEAPSYVSEGVHLQYSINNGSSWTDFPGPNLNPIGTNSTTGPFITTTPGSGGYWAPVSGAAAQSNCPLYFWHRYSCMVPPVASINNGKFRWAQLSNSSAGWDAWGIDEVEIFCPTGAINILWTPVGFPTDTIDTLWNPSSVFPPQHPNYIPYDTCFVVKVCDTVNSATDTVCIHVNPIPTSDFSISNDTIFVNTPLSFYYTGNADTNAYYYWDIDNNILFSGQGPHVYTFSKTGTYIISLVVKQNNCESIKTIKQVTVINNPGIKESSKDILFKIIPTESENIFTLQTLGISGKTEIRINNCTGQLIKSFSLNINSYKFEKSINLSGLNSGIYYINLSNEKVRTTRKIFVQ